MAFTNKEWKNAPSTQTPLDAAALQDEETRLSAYTDEEVTAERERAEAAEAAAQAAAEAASIPASAKGKAEGVPSSEEPLAITGTPSAGQVLTATSGTAADWQAGSGGVSKAEVESIASTKANTAETNAKGSSLQKAENLKDLATASTARTNLGLGTAAVEPASAFDAKGAAATARTEAEAASIPIGQKGANSGVMALTSGGIGAQPPAHHASTHAEGGTDPLTVGDLPSSVVNSSGATSGYVPVANGENGYAWGAQGGGGGGEPLRVIHALSSPQRFGSSFEVAELCWRQPFKLPVATTRWRLRVRNICLHPEEVVENALAFVGAYLGAAKLSGAEPNGEFVSTPLEALGAFTTAADGAEYISGWVTAETLQIPANTLMMLSLGYTGGNTSHGVPTDFGMVWTDSSTGAVARIAQIATTGFTLNAQTPLDIRIEYETTASSKGVYLAVGDSITRGTGGVGMPNWKSYPVIYATQQARPVENAGVGGTVFSEWESKESWKYQRFAPGTTTEPTVVTVALGTNDIHAEVSLAEMEANCLKVLTAIGELWPKARIVGLPILPRNAPAAFGRMRLARDTAAGVTTLVVLDEPPNLKSHKTALLGEGLTGQKVELTEETSEENGLHIVHLKAVTTEAHKAGEALAEALEEERLLFNSWFSGLPATVAAFAATDQSVVDPGDRWSLQAANVQADGIHPTESGAARLASALHF